MAWVLTNFGEPYKTTQETVLNCSPEKAVRDKQTCGGLVIHELELDDVSPTSLFPVKVSKGRAAQ